MPQRAPRRTLVGTSKALGSWQRVYETPEAIEVDETEGFTARRRRVFYDEVLLVTYHQFVPWAVALVAGVLSLGFGGMAAITALAGSGTATAVLLLIGSPAFVALALAAFVKYEAITVYGRRSKAQVCFWLRKAAARQAFSRICARVRHAQERARGLSAARAESGLPGPTQAAS